MDCKKETEYARIILGKLLFDGEECEDLLNNQMEVDKFLFKKILTENRITVRTLSKLNSAVLDYHGLNDVLDIEKKRVGRNLSFLAEVKTVFEKEKIEYIVIKSLDNYPDMGHDIDLLILNNKKKVTELLRARFGGIIAKPVLSELLSDKTNINFPNLPVLEIHNKRFGQVGEDMLYPRILMRNKILKHINGNVFFVPKDEDKVIITAYHRLYRHFNIRICDVYNTATLISANNFDWNYLWKIAEEIGLTNAVKYYLDYVKNLRTELNQEQGLKIFLNRFQVKKSYFRYPLFKITVKIYFKKFVKLIKSFNFISALKLCLILPLLLIVAIQKSMGRKASW